MTAHVVGRSHREQLAELLKTPRRKVRCLVIVERPNPENDPIPIPLDLVAAIDAAYTKDLEAERDSLVAALVSVHGWLRRRVICRPLAEIEALFDGTEYETRIHYLKRKR